jgi:uncharacterized protein (DUF305 family)
MSRSPRRGTSVLAVALALAGAACASGDDTGTAARDVNIVQPGAPGESSEQLDEAPQRQRPEHTDADVAFVRDMLAHHAQALRMTRLVPDRTQRDDLPLLAERMDLSQEAEIELMRGWLEARGEDVPSLTDHGHEAGRQDMPGMLTERELLALEAADGETFDRLFLTSMIRHHEGALVMVQQLFAAGGGEEREIARFATHVEADQTVELGRMRSMLEELGEP